MFIVLVKGNSKYSIIGFAENIEDIKNIINKNDLKDKIDNGKAYLIEGNIKLIRPETTPGLLNETSTKGKSNKYY